LEEARHFYVDPHHQYKSTVDRFVKGFTDPLVEIQRYLSKLSGNYQAFLKTEQRRIQAEQEAEARRLEAEQKKEAEAQAKKGVYYEPAPIPAPVAPEVPKTTVTASGKASYREHWTYEVVDESLVDRDLMSVDHKKIRERVKGGLRESPGLRIYKEEITQIRT
jgi:hypothetical protein